MMWSRHSRRQDSQTNNRRSALLRAGLFGDLRLSTLICRAIAVVVTTASRSRRRYLISPDLEAAERIGPERRGYGDVDPIAPPCHQPSPHPRPLLPSLEPLPPS